jgi:hypothetical protein
VRLTTFTLRPKLSQHSRYELVTFDIALNR